MKRFILWIAFIAVSLSSATARQYSASELKAMFTFAPKPEYPYKLRFVQRLEGSGVFRMFVDEHGKVANVTVLQSTRHPELDAEAIKGLIRWKARPGPKREVDIPITFSLARPAPLPGSTHGRGSMGAPED